MADGRKNNGGARKGAGRKPKNDEQALIDSLSPYSDVAHEKLKEAVEKGEQWAVKMYFDYFYGKPNQTINHKNNGGSFDDLDLKAVSTEDIERLLKEHGK